MQYIRKHDPVDAIQYLGEDNATEFLDFCAKRGLSVEVNVPELGCVTVRGVEMYGKGSVDGFILDRCGWLCCQHVVFWAVDGETFGRLYEPFTPAPAPVASSERPAPESSRPPAPPARQGSDPADGPTAAG